MITSLTDAEIRFPFVSDEPAERMAELAGIIEDVIVRLSGESRFTITVIDCKRLEVEIERASHEGRHYFARAGMIVASRASSWITTIAACWAANQDYFRHLNPLQYPVIRSNIASITLGSGDESTILQAASDRGYLEGICVALDDVRQYELTFMLPSRLSREIELDSVNGRPFFAQPGLVVVQDISKDSISSATRSLADEGYFDHLRPT